MAWYDGILNLAKSLSPDIAPAKQTASISSLYSTPVAPMQGPTLPTQNYTSVPPRNYTSVPPATNQANATLTSGGSAYIAPPTIRPLNSYTPVPNYTPVPPQNTSTTRVSEPAPNPTQPEQPPSYNYGPSLPDAPAINNFASISSGGPSYSGGSSPSFPGSSFGGGAGLSTGSGIGGSNTYPVNSQEDPNNPKKKNQPPGIIPYDGFNIPRNPDGSAMFVPTTTPQGGTAYKDTGGNVYIPTQTNGGTVLQLAPNTLPGNTSSYTNLGYNQGGGLRQVNAPVQIQPGAPSSGFSAGSAPSVLDVAAKEAAQKISELMKDPTIAQDPVKAARLFQDIYNQKKQELQASNPTPEFPVVPTPEQSQWEQQNPGQVGVIDGIRQKVGLPGIEKEILSKQTEINALNDTLLSIVKDIKDNPELPKGLAQKRIEEFSNKSALTMKTLQGQLDTLSKQRDYANDAVNQELGIYKFNQQMSQDKMQSDRNYQLAVQNANKPDTTMTEVNGQRVIVDNKTNKIITTLGKAGEASTDTTAKKTETILKDFHTDLVKRETLDKAGNREQFIRQLQSQYPTMNPDGIAQWVYTTYPDGYDKTE